MLPAAQAPWGASMLACLSSTLSCSWMFHFPFRNLSVTMLLTDLVSNFSSTDSPGRPPGLPCKATDEMSWAGCNVNREEEPCGWSGGIHVTIDSGGQQISSFLLHSLWSQPVISLLSIIILSRYLHTTYHGIAWLNYQKESVLKRYTKLQSSVNAFLC